MVLRLSIALAALLLLLDPAAGVCWDIDPDPPDPRGEIPEWNGKPITGGDIGRLPTTPRDGLKRPPRPRTPRENMPGGARTDGLPPIPPVGESGWSRWWFFNRSPYLVAPAAAVTEASEGVKADRDTPLDDWRPRAIDTLRKILEEDRTDTSSGAAVALGKARARSAIPRLARIVADRREKRERREAAALALGMIGGEDAREALRTVFSSNRESWHCRAFAGIGLGLTGEKEALPSLLETARAGHRELQASALMGVGLLGDKIAEDLLLAMAHDRKRRLDPLVRAAAVHALARIRSPERMPALLEIVKSDRAEVRRAAVQALGRVAGPTDWPALTALVAAAEKDGDAGTRRYATIALGRTGSPGVVAACERILDGPRMEERGFAAIAMALAGRKTTDRDLRRSISDRLLKRLTRAKLAPDTEAAIAVGLGILGEKRALAPIRKLLKAPWSGSRGHAAVALGMLGDRESLPALRKAMVEENIPWVQREVAIALGLFRDGPSVTALAARVKKGKSELARGNAALALGQIATPEAATAMVELLGEDDLSGPTRTKVTAALGHALDTKPLPTLYPLTEDLDYDLTLITIHRLLHRL